MDLLGQLMGGDQRRDFDDFSQRYEQGAPWDGFDDDEALDKYRRVAPNVPQDVYQQSAEETFSRLTPEQRYELGQRLQQSARNEGLQFDADGDGLRDPGSLARATSRIHQERPGLMEQLIGGATGGGGGGLLSGGLGKAALGGIAAMAFKKMAGGR